MMSPDSISEHAPMVLFSHTVMVSNPISSQLLRPFIQASKSGEMSTWGGSKFEEGFIFILNLLEKASTRGLAVQLYSFSQQSSQKMRVSVFKYSMMVLVRCSAIFPSMSASTAVLQRASMGISPVFRCWSCRLNSLVTSRARMGLGTARTCRYGVLMVLLSNLIRQLCK